jgi:hypothetical protein
VTAPHIPDGTYYGYQPMPNLSPDEDPHAYWYHANVMTIRGARLEMKNSPVYESHGKMIWSASDGGFYRYEGTIETLGARLLFRVRGIDCDYCGIRADLFERTDEYVARVNADGSFEVDHVTYRATPDPRFQP